MFDRDDDPLKFDTQDIIDLCLNHYFKAIDSGVKSEEARRINNYFEAIEVKKVVAAATQLKDFFLTRKDPLLTRIRTKAALNPELEAELKTACDEWKTTLKA